MRDDLGLVRSSLTACRNLPNSSLHSLSTTKISETNNEAARNVCRPPPDIADTFYFLP
jgi:hypothetical protein